MCASKHWVPPDKNCGLCGLDTCANFLRMVLKGHKIHTDCPFHADHVVNEGSIKEAVYSGRDILGHAYDFILSPLPGEISARKIVLPFRPDLVEKLAIGEGDHVLGRPMGAGCPIPHVLRVISAQPLTGLLFTWVVGPKFSREATTKNVIAYHMIGFEGIATEITREPLIGCRATFLPGFCMMTLNHTGIVNMVLEKRNGLHVRIEDIHIMAGHD